MVRTKRLFRALVCNQSDTYFVGILLQLSKQIMRFLRQFSHFFDGTKIRFERELALLVAFQGESIWKAGYSDT